MSNRTRQRRGLADMSLPPEERRRKTRGRARTPVPAQMSHASNGKGRKKSREGERKLAAGWRPSGLGRLAWDVLWPEDALVGPLAAGPEAD
jgi:hypothetical protein